MGVNTGISCGSGQILILSIGDMRPVFGEIFLGQSEIDDIQLMTAFAAAHQKIIGLNIPVQEVSAMNVLDSNLKEVTSRASGPSA